MAHSRVVRSESILWLPFFTLSSDVYLPQESQLSEPGTVQFHFRTMPIIQQEELNQVVEEIKLASISKCFDGETTTKAPEERRNKGVVVLSVLILLTSPRYQGFYKRNRRQKLRKAKEK